MSEANLQGPVEMILAEIETAPLDEALTGTAAILSLIGRATLKRLHLEPEGKADVKFEVDEDTKIVIRWNGS